MDFRCVSDCAQCCIEREYYPSKKYGKVGVLILPEEKKRIEELAKKNKLKVSIVPRIGISNQSKKLEKILAYQLMGIEENGNTCPFLDTNSGKKSPHGGFPCKIYEKRPLACRAYPLIESNPIQLDSKCKFCQEHGSTDKNLNSEIESLVKIKTKMNPNGSYVWRYATGVGEDIDKDEIQEGWILEKI
jgi:uncharacterized protein